MIEKKNALIIGAGGFVGEYLIRELSANGWESCATKLPSETINTDVPCDICDMNILDSDSIERILEAKKPDCIFHLAAQSSVALSWKNPALTVDVNIKGSVNLLEAVRKSKLNPRVILIGSGEEYGYSANLGTAVNESTTPDPASIYAITKYTQNMIGKLYHRAYGMDIISVRAFNHIGPGQASQFVVSDFCRQTAEIEAGLHEPTIYVGNLSSMRDFTDVRDIVRAYREIALKGASGETYNVGSGKTISVLEVLDMILALSKAKITIETDESKFRPADIPKIEADVSKLKNDIGWLPEINLNESLEDIIDYWREKLK